jgi:DNA-binding Lrp family transcriptional regulator
MDLSDDDRALLNVLQVAPRISWQDAGETLGRHPTTLAAQWERLRGQGIAWVTAHLLGDLSGTTVSFVDVDCELRLRDAVAAALCAMPEVQSVEESASNRDLGLTVATSSWADLTGRILPKFARIPGLIRYRSVVCTAVHASADSWRMGALSAPQQARLRAHLDPKPKDYAGPLPSSYWPMVQELARNGRATAVDIGVTAGLHPVTARRQLNRVLASGTLTFRCEMAQSYSGFPINCQWYASLPPGERQRAVEVLRGFRGLRLCASTTGVSNFTFMMWLRSPAEIIEIEDRFLRAVPGARIIESSLTVKFLKRAGWLLDKETTTAISAVVPEPAPAPLG